MCCRLQAGVVRDTTKKGVTVGNYPFGGLDGKTALITGAGGGIGGACARLLGEESVNLILTDIKQEAIEQQLELGGGADEFDVEAIVEADLCNEGDLNQLIAAAQSDGGIDFLIPAAGIYPEVPVSEMSDADWEQVFDINVTSVFKLVRESLPQLNEGGSIVNFGSIAGARGSMNHAHYSASKGAIGAFTRSLALELAPKNIRVNAVAPGIIETPMIDELVVSSGDKILADTPLGRYGKAEEIASVVTFLCSSGASFITGETVHVNGGFYMT